uniref:Ion transport domain-containing protein n=1 Tax=Tetradesmus obliquus TaxID=3088 RepID=A0A383W424_TETOB|eukprot:jgi/Sobl393_1/16821/SZX72395.1
MKRTRPSISALLASAPHGHAKLPPLAAATALTAADAGDGLHGQPEAAVADPRGAPPSLRSSADGSAARVGSALTQGARAPWQETPCSASSAAPGEQRPAASPPPWGPAMPAGQEDHLLLRQPAYVAALPAHPRLSEQARQDEAHDGVPHKAALPPQEQQRQQQQQQQRAGWLDALYLPKLLRRRAPSQEQQQHPASANPADSFHAAAPAAAAGSSSSTNSRGSSSGRWKARRVRLLQALDSPGASWLLMVMTLFVIFQEDVKYAVLPPGADLGLEAVTLALLLLFLVEIGLSCVVRPHFFLSFYFWLDTVAVLSLAFELPALRAVLLLGATQEYINLAAADSYLMAAGAQALVSSKAGRAAKMVRLFRQLQLIRLFRQLEVRQRLKAALAAAEQALPEQGLAGEAELAAVEARVMAKYQGGQSRVGQRLSDLTMKRVISGVLAMLVVLPALEISSGINGRDTPLALGGLHMLHSTAITAGSASQAFNSSLQVRRGGVGEKLRIK